jgi:23S rRNA (uridine2552-2'-O)-methyltransferase
MLQVCFFMRRFSRNWVYRPPAPEKPSFLSRFRSKSAFKLLELNERYSFLKPGMRVLDLGCSPGGWSEVAVAAVQSTVKEPTVWGVDLQSAAGLDGCNFLVADVSQDESHAAILTAVKTQVDVVLSDLAKPTSQDVDIDSESQWSLCLDALRIANFTLKPGGTILFRMLLGLGESEHFVLPT